MTQQWNKYEKTAARRHGKPGREVRPKSLTIDIHSHVGVPQAAKFVEPHLNWATVPLAHFADAETKALSQKQEADIRARAGIDDRLADLDAMELMSRSSRRRRRSATTRCRLISRSKPRSSSTRASPSSAPKRRIASRASARYRCPTPRKRRKNSSAASSIWASKASRC